MKVIQTFLFLKHILDIEILREKHPFSTTKSEIRIRFKTSHQQEILHKICLRYKYVYCIKLLADASERFKIKFSQIKYSKNALPIYKDIFISTFFDVVFASFILHKIFWKEGKQTRQQTKATIYNSIPKEKKINAEDNRMKVDCVHFILKNWFAVGCQSEKRTKKDEETRQTSMSEKTCIVSKCF